MIHMLSGIKQDGAGFHHTSPNVFLGIHEENQEKLDARSQWASPSPQFMSIAFGITREIEQFSKLS